VAMWALLKLAGWQAVYRVAGYLGDCVGLYFACLVVWTLWKGKRPRHARIWMRSVSRWRRFKEKGIVNGFALSNAFAIACLLLLCISAYAHRYNVVTEHNVAILSRLDNGDFAYRSDEKPNGDTYRPCSIDKENGIDVDGMLTQAVGYIAEHATWQEQGTCRSILRPEWQFWFRDAENKFTYRKVN
jgi:hypothetical protein